ncbi:MAG: diaminopimelate epimerase [Thermoguttaceae bacterium]|nr:diaminopimelate epimerase [Thermoguttaceae bacterium]
MQIPFTKMHGIGNDYVYINGFTDLAVENSHGRRLSERPVMTEAELVRLAQKISDRHFGVGGDGMILILPSDKADGRMRMFNADGSESEMCGNGVRCVAKYLYDHGIATKPVMTVETGRCVLTLQIVAGADGLAKRIRVDMGEPILEMRQIPAAFPRLKTSDAVIDQPLTLTDERCGTVELRGTCVSMGNPHFVIFPKCPSEQELMPGGIGDEYVLQWGPKLEFASEFPRRANIEFVYQISPTEVRMRVWERGTGETLACGTGACAVGVACVLTGRTQRQLTVHLAGGELEIEWDEQTNHVFMTGSATTVFSGIYPYETT